MERYGVGNFIELITSAAIVVACLPYLFEAAHKAATTSLWLDEIGSIAGYSSQGPWTTITKYNAANNHIFFNLLNSLTPGAGSYDPLHARLWSIVAVLAALGLAGYELGRRRWFLAGAIFVFLLTINHDLLELCLEARGYGILLFCATAAALWAMRYVQTPARRWLVALSVVVVVGTWTVPTFVFFGGGVWLAMLAFERSWRVLRYGAATLGAIVVVYLPVMGQLRAQEATYAQQFGRNYDHISDVWSTIRTYLPLHLPSVFAVAIFAILAAVAALVRPSRLGHERWVTAASWVLLGASAVFFAGCLILQTPLLRTTAFVVAPLALAVLAPAAVLVRQRNFEVIRPTAAITAAVLLVPAGLTYAKGHPFIPFENWKGADAYVAATFPDNTPVFNERSTTALASYLSSHDRLDTNFDIHALLGGQLVVVDVRELPKPTHSEAAIAPVAASLVTQGFFEQRGKIPAHFMLVWFAPPPDPHLTRAMVSGASQPELLDGNLSTDVPLPPTPDPPTVELTVAPGTIGRSVVIAGSAYLPVRGVVVTTISPAGVSHRVAQDHLATSRGLLTVHLGDVAVSRIEVTMGPSARPYDLDDIWLYTP